MRMIATRLILFGVVTNEIKSLLQKNYAKIMKRHVEDHNTLLVRRVNAIGVVVKGTV